MNFPVNLEDYEKISINLSQNRLSVEQKKQLLENIALVRDSIVFFTAFANTKGLGGHTGGAYDIVPELLIIDSLIKTEKSLYPVFFDEAGHRVAIQYTMAVLNGHMALEKLLHYREFNEGLYGHPERNDSSGIFFSSGRLGHLWSHVNGVALANPEKNIIMFGSDGSQQEGGDAEAARFAVARNLNVKLLIDDNDVTIAGHPSEYMKGFSVERTLNGHGIKVDTDDGENVDLLFKRIRKALTTPGPFALINYRKMAVGIEGIEGTTKGHDVIPVENAILYLKRKGHDEAVHMLESNTQVKGGTTYLGSSKEKYKNRDEFGKIIVDILKDIPDRKDKILVIDSDLEGSCGLHHIHKNYPEIYLLGGIMERNNFSVAAGFGSTPEKMGIFGTFSAFLEMVISEITMARLNNANVLAHFSHSGVDDMADNTCHFGINNFFADNGLGEQDLTRLYYPADKNQLKAVIESVFHQKGLRFIFTTRSAAPTILNEQDKPYYGKDYIFEPGKDEVIREGGQGCIVTYGEMVYRCLDVVDRFRRDGVEITLINKPTLNVIDKEMIKKVKNYPFVLVFETQNEKTGLGSKFGTYLIENGFKGYYDHLGTHKEGHGGLAEQIPYQGLSQESIREKILKLI